jgi:isopenicillin N synthase-like dioxygenase
MHSGVSLSLGLPENFFKDRFTDDPFTPFRLFHYPAQTEDKDDSERPWGVGEHTDYGVLTILATDGDGLEVKLRNGEWVSAPYIPYAFIVNSAYF